MQIQAQRYFSIIMMDQVVVTAVGDTVYTHPTNNTYPGGKLISHLFTSLGNNYYIRINNTVGLVTESTNCNPPTP